MELSQAIAAVRQYRRIEVDYEYEELDYGSIVLQVSGRGARLEPMAIGSAYDPSVRDEAIRRAGAAFVSLLTRASASMQEGLDDFDAHPAVYLTIDPSRNQCTIDYGSHVLLALHLLSRDPCSLSMHIDDVDPEFVRAPYWDEEVIGPIITADDLVLDGIDYAFRVELHIRMDGQDGHGR